MSDYGHVCSGFREVHTRNSRKRVAPGQPQKQNRGYFKRHPRYDQRARSKAKPIFSVFLTKNRVFSYLNTRLWSRDGFGRHAITTNRTNYLPTHDLAGMTYQYRRNPTSLLKSIRPIYNPVRKCKNRLGIYIHTERSLHIRTEYYKNNGKESRERRLEVVKLPAALRPNAGTQAFPGPRVSGDSNI